jgi:hypothetical protein|tara:strand:+ start:7328 stop:7897 length:570 start_codon:yes stop_codon:yes gene_type:complete
MVITIHQPEHFPYMGFFQKMKVADVFVVLDNVNYRKNYFQNRNKFLNKNGVEEWFTMQVEKGSTSKHIKDVKVVEGPWKRKILTKHFQNLGINLESIYSHNKLIDINIKSIEYCRNILNITTPIIYASDLNVKGTKSELLANIVKNLKGTTYLSGPSGKDYLNKEYFKDIKVDFFEPKVENYYSTLYNI